MIERHVKPFMTDEETCPICGGRIHRSIILVNPAINKADCIKCGSAWKKEEKEIKGDVFNPEGWEKIK